MNSDTPHSMLASFVNAFSQLDLETMLACFEDEATAFFPVEHQPRRMEGKPAIGRAFATVIARLRASGATVLPLDVADLVIQDLDDICIASFHLAGERFGRRTIVLRRRIKEWRICHIHASNAYGGE